MCTLLDKVLKLLLFLLKEFGVAFQDSAKTVI